MAEYKILKTDENDWAVAIERDGEWIPIAMSIADERTASDIARHLNLSQDAPRSQHLFLSKRPDADLVITAGKGFHIRFANGRSASVQWGTGSYCQNQDLMRGRDWFEIQIKDEHKRKIYKEFTVGHNVYYEQMFADWGSDDAEISPGISETEEGWVKPDKIIEILYSLSKMPALEGGKEPVDIDKALRKMMGNKEDQELLNEVERWKNGTDRHDKVHEWREYLTMGTLLENWEHLTPRERLLCYFFCREQASLEDY